MKRSVPSALVILALLTGSVVSAGAEEIKLVYSPSAKLCTKNDDGQQVCLTGKEARVESSGLLAAAALLIEPDGGQKKLRIVVALEMQTKFGTRVMIDQGKPINAPYALCFEIGCVSDYPIDTETASRLSRGQQLVVQAINATGQPISVPLPLADFGKASSSSPVDVGRASDTLKTLAKLPLRLDRTAPDSRPTPVAIATYSPWTKFCLTGKEAGAKRVCFTGIDARIESGMPVAAAVLIEPEGEPKKLLRVTLPLGTQLQFGTRVIIDQNQPSTGPYVICFTNGCMSDYEVTPDFLTRLKKGRSLTIQSAKLTGEVASVALPLGQMAAAHEGPPTDPKAFEEQQKRLNAGLQSRQDPSLQSPQDQRPPPRIAGAETRVALVVGNSDYSSVPTLANPDKDAETIAAVLRNIGFKTVTLEKNTTRERLLAALRQFADQAEQADWAVVYFAGHGMEIGGVNYLIPVDARLKVDRDVPDEAISLDRVLTAIEGAKKLRLVVLDACRDNPFAAQMRRTVATRSVGRGLARVEPDGGTLVAFAAKHGEVALDGEGRNSPFVGALAKHLVTPNLEVNKLFRLVRDDVLAATSRKQEPFVYGSLPGEDFFFVQR